MPVLLFVDPLPLHYTSTDLRGLFGKYGTVVSAVIACDRSGQSLRFGRVEMATEEDAARACQKLHGSELHGERLKVVPCTDRAPGT